MRADEQEPDTRPTVAGGPSLIRRTAVCGPACKVVWQGRRGDPSPYADCPVNYAMRIFEKHLRLQHRLQGPPKHSSRTKKNLTMMIDKLWMAEPFKALDGFPIFGERSTASLEDNHRFPVLRPGTMMCSLWP
jgi:hypothetical protein